MHLEGASGFHDAVWAAGTPVPRRWEGRRERRAAAASQRGYWQPSALPACRRSSIDVPRWRFQAREERENGEK